MVGAWSGSSYSIMVKSESVENGELELFLEE